MNTVARRLGPVLLPIAGAFLLFSIGVASASYYAADVVLPASARASGLGAEWYTTLWVTNPGAAQDVELRLMKAGQANPEPQSVTVRLDDRIPRDRAAQLAPGPAPENRQPLHPVLERRAPHHDERPLPVPPQLDHRPHEVRRLRRGGGGRRRRPAAAWLTRTAR